MFDKWLLFFYSNKNTINNKPITKEWLDDGQMKISGNEPTEWSIIIKPEIFINIYTYIYQFEKKKKDAIAILKNSLLLKDKKKFDEALKLYDESNKEVKKLENIIRENKSKMDNINNEIFEIKKNIYHSTGKQDIKQLNEKLEKAINNKIILAGNFKKEEENYILSDKALIKKGPIPDVPTIKSQTYKVIRKKFEFDSSDIKNSISNFSQTTQTNLNQQGGFVKVIKLS